MFVCAGFYINIFFFIVKSLVCMQIMPFFSVMYQQLPYFSLRCCQWKRNIKKKRPLWEVKLVNFWSFWFDYFHFVFFSGISFFSRVNKFLCITEYTSKFLLPFSIHLLYVALYIAIFPFIIVTVICNLM